MMLTIVSVAGALAMFAMFLWTARHPRKMVEMRRAFLLEDGRVSDQEIWLLRGLGALCIGCSAWAAVVSGHAVFALGLIPAGLLIHGIIELMRRNLLTRLVGQYWTVRLTALALWGMAIELGRSGAWEMALGFSLIGVVVAVWPGRVARFLANYASVETQVKRTRASGIFGCVIAVLAIALILWASWRFGM